ncbi:pyridoxamine 5'-phosphate oxidase family protein [Oscillibacter sp.]|uniref:pyridoxamine 5'-phosphate oxidase family protein n=1 Tax=Oscillibacter sp. TaxID=1945593 RepID=UPI0028A8DF36|nr:pyridoxamine 5'-phosphate oxidase family protein [Oscillibacter sp.]
MFREMRRKRQLLSEEDAVAVLNRGTAGVLALSGDDDYPYAVPLSYVYDGSKIYFHGAKEGHKLDAMRRCEKASFCVVDRDQVVPEEYTSYFRSVIVFGAVRIVEDDTEKLEAIKKLAIKYAPENTDQRLKSAIDREWNPLCVMEMIIHHMTGKEAVELMKKRPKQGT